MSSQPNQAESDQHAESTPTSNGAADASAAAPAATGPQNGIPVQLFDTKRPKHLFEGFSAGAKNIGKGVASATAAVAIGTAGGAKKKGVLGGLAGFVGGAVVGAGLLVGGLCTGTQQCVNGIIQTPVCAIKGAGNEEMWDEVSHRWVKFYLNKESREVPVNDEDLFGQYKQIHDPSEQPSEVMPESECCEVLGINAEEGKDANKVRRAYLKLALRVHPDKNPNDPEAAIKFRKINIAQETLTKKYAAPSSDNEPHPSTGPSLAAENPIEMALGARIFEPLIGRQKFLLYVAHLQFCGASIPHELLQTFSRRRSVRVASHLVRMLDSVGDNVQAVDPLLHTLLETPLGPELVHLIGERYILVGRSFLGAGNPLEVVSAAAKRFVEITDSRVKVVKSMYDKDVLHTLLNICRPDIVFTVDWSARMVLHDLSTEEAVRKTRAEHMAAIGLHFTESAAKAKEVRASRESAENGMS